MSVALPPVRNPPPELPVALAAAAAGAEVLRGCFGGPLDVEHKQSWNLVSQADRESERAVIETIRAAFPGDGILGEESAPAQTGHDRLWVVDPLDGTTNFVHGLDHFSISIAWYCQGIARLGVILCPIRNDRYVAVRGQGAWRNGQAAAVSTTGQLTESLLGVGFFYDRGRQMQATLQAMQWLFERQIRGFRRMGTASLDLCMVGCGQLDGYFELELAAWDFSAGKLFVEEAGGRVTRCDGGHVGLHNTSVLASNGPLHDELLQVLEPVCSQPASTRPGPVGQDPSAGTGEREPLP